MKAFSLGRAPVWTCAVVLFLGGCAEGALTNGMPAQLSGGASGSATGARPALEMLPGTSGQDLLYVLGAGAAYILSYPGGTLQGTTQAISEERQICSDTQGDIYVTSGLQPPGEIFEFSHGGTQPIRTLKDAAGAPLGCAVDTTTGNLAVANELGPNSGNGNVVVYKQAKGKPTIYSLPPGNGTAAFFCAYDAKGNLFVNNSGIHLDKLARGTAKLKTVTIEKSPLSQPRALQWDGQYLAIEVAPLF